MFAALSVRFVNGTDPACKVPVISTRHSEAPASDLKFMKLPVGEVSVNRDPLSMSVPLALWPASRRLLCRDIVTAPAPPPALTCPVVPAITVAPPHVPQFASPPEKQSS